MAISDDELEGRLVAGAFILAFVSVALYVCIKSGPCGNICGSLPSWLASFFPCNGPGTGGSNASQSVLDEFNNILNNLEQQESTPQGCSGSSDFGNCVPAPDSFTGVASITESN